MKEKRNKRNEHMESKAFKDILLQQLRKVNMQFVEITHKE